MSLLARGTKIGDRYVIEGEIGRGGMQEVYRAYDETLDRVVALKVPQDARVARKFRSSAVLSARVNHPNVAKTLDYLESGDGMFYMVEELVEGENLRDIAGRFARLDAHIAIHVLHHLARGLAASHRVGVVHRDLKPSNIMVAGALSFQAVKITDFGIAKMAEHEVDNAVAGGEDATRSSRTVMNALAYVAPEVIEAPRTASKPADVWAIAAISWELLTGHPPFGTGLKAIRAISMGERPVLPPTIVSHVQFGALARSVHELIMTCLAMNPADRPTADELAEKCGAICYLPPVRELGTIENYVSSFGFARSEAGKGIFFHTRSVVADDPRPPVGTQIWYGKFDGAPNPRAIPVVPLNRPASEIDLDNDACVP